MKKEKDRDGESTGNAGDDDRGGGVLGMASGAWADDLVGVGAGQLVENYAMSPEQAQQPNPALETMTLQAAAMDQPALPIIRGRPIPEVTRPTTPPVPGAVAPVSRTDVILNNYHIPLLERLLNQVSTGDICSACALEELIDIDNSVFNVIRTNPTEGYGPPRLILFRHSMMSFTIRFQEEGRV